jgi:hypothetical protein
MLAYLADHKPIAGAMVSVTVRLPNTEWQIVELFDDGKHEDGKADDGVYANTYVLPDIGLYQLKVWGGGENNSGQRFVRRLTRSFYVRPRDVRPRVAYVYKDDLTTATSYEKLLEGHSLAVDLLPMTVVSDTGVFNPYQLIVVGPDTGYMSSWDGSAGVNNIAQSRKPVIGLGEGGYALFGRLGLDIGHAHGWHGNENRIYVVTPTHPIYNTPYPIPVPPKDPILTVYTSTTHVGINLPDPPADVTLLGREPSDENHYPLVQQIRYLFWGFDYAPSAMTETGKRLFVNTAWHMMP